MRQVCACDSWCIFFPHKLIFIILKYNDLINNACVLVLNLWDLIFLLVSVINKTMILKTVSSALVLGLFSLVLAEDGGK